MFPPMEPFGEIQFRNLLRKELKEFAAHLADSPQDIDAYVQNLASDLSKTITEDDIDEEHVYIVALRHRNSFPRHLLEDISRRLKGLAPARIAELFAAAFGWR